MPKWMDNCVSKYKKDNPKASDQSAWAVCTAGYKKKFGKAPVREDLAAITLLEGQMLTFSTGEKERVLQRAVRAKYIEMSDDPYDWPSAWIVAVYDDQHEVVVVQGDRLYALPYSFVDQWTAEVGEPREVVAAMVDAETESVNYVLTQAWLPESIDKLDDQDFAWLSTEYTEATEEQRGSMPRHLHRQLPFAVHGAVHVDGWRAAWKLLQFESYMRPVLTGGPTREECIKVLEAAKPEAIDVGDDGTCVTEEVGMRSLTESYKSGLVIESAEPDSGFDYMIKGSVVPAPDTRHGTYSRNRRLYTKACIHESYGRSITFLKEEVATIHTSHHAAMPLAARLPVGKVTELWMEGDAMKFRGGIAPTTDGQDLRVLIETGVLERVSLRTREWKAEYKEVGDLGHVEVMEWFVLHGIDFTEVAGLDGTKIRKEGLEEELDMKLSELTLAQLQESRPELIAEIVEGAAPEPTVEFKTPPEVELNVAILEASNTGAGSLVAEYLAERVETPEDLTEELLQEARTEAATKLYGQHTPAPPTNLKGSATPAPEPKEPKEGDKEDPPLTEAQREMVELAGGTLTE